MRIKAWPLWLLLAGCTSNRNLPKPQEVIDATHGANIEAHVNPGTITKGELIAADTAAFWILDRTTKKLKKLEVGKLRSYRITYARTPLYEFCIPLFMATSFAHGNYFIAQSMIVNALVTTGVAVSAKTQFTFTNKNLPPAEAFRYARFPAGIPAGINETEIR
jgi:hypothetical protein